jgi:hypothetical protein
MPKPLTELAALRYVMRLRRLRNNHRDIFRHISGIASRYGNQPFAALPDNPLIKRALYHGLIQPAEANLQQRLAHIELFNLTELYRDAAQCAPAEPVNQRSN